METNIVDCEKGISTIEEMLQLQEKIKDDTVSKQLTKRLNGFKAELEKLKQALGLHNEWSKNGDVQSRVEDLKKTTGR